MAKKTVTKKVVTKGNKIAKPSLVLTAQEKALATSIKQHVKGASSLISRVKAAIETRFGAGSAPIKQADYSAWSFSMAAAVGSDNKRAWAKLATIAKGDRALVTAEGKDISATRKLAAQNRAAAKAAEAIKKAKTPTGEKAQTLAHALTLVIAASVAALAPSEQETFSMLCAKIADYDKAKNTASKRTVPASKKAEATTA